MRTSMTPNRREGGFIIYVLVMLIVLAAVLGITARGVFQSLLRERPRERAAFAAVYAAGGGVEWARAGLARDPSRTGGTVEVGRARADVSVLPVPGEPDLRDIIAIGTVPGAGAGSIAARIRIEARVRLGPGLPRILSWREGARPGPRPGR
jgi:hypothetical protein